MSRFPKDFAFGTAMAAYQVEGGNHRSDYWVYESVDGSEFTEPSGSAVGHYRLFGSDIALLASLGFNAIRLSIEWARIQPGPESFSEMALAHYRSVLEKCNEYGLRPMVTLHHFSSPQWLIAQGGWESEATPGYFALYAERMAVEYGHLVSGFCTMNEVNTGRLTAATAMFGLPEQRRNAPWAINSAQQIGVGIEQFCPWSLSGTAKGFAVITDSHRAGVAALRQACDVPVGLSLATQDFQIVGDASDVARRLQYEIQDEFLEHVQDDDYVGVQTYTRMRVGEAGILGPEDGVELTQMGYEFYPEALEATIRHIAGAAHCAVIVTENGIGTTDDVQRVRYLKDALAGLDRCLADGVDVRGYYCWSALDNFEWEFGFGPKFGLIEVDPETFERRPKASAYWLGAQRRNDS